MKTIGSRIRHLRTICSLSRRQFAEKYGIKEPTLRSWELDIASISSSLIKKLIHALLQEGILCTEEWIRLGQGEPPYITNLKFKKISKDYSPYLVGVDEEIKRFLSSHPNAIVYFVEDECNMPLYKRGDVVGGIKIPLPTKISDVEGQLGIVPLEPLTNRLGLRIIRLSEEENKVSLTSLKCETNTRECKIIYDVAIEFFAPILWYRRIN